MIAALGAAAAAEPYTGRRSPGMEGRAAMWAVFGPLIAFKIVATALLFAHAPVRDALLLSIGTGWAWFVLGAALVAAPAAGWYRLLRARSRRAQLQRAEWMLEAPARRRRPSPPPSSRTLDAQWPRWESVPLADRDS